MSEELKPRDCPFCGGQALSMSEGSTFRWRVLSCDCCGANAGETRIKTAGEGTQEDWAANCKAEAIAAWNRRAQPAAPAVDARMCLCKDRPLSACPGEWEPGCDLGNNPAFVRRSPNAAPSVAEQPEPVAWMWQHEETGRTGFVAGDFDRAHWEEHNPRLKIISPCFSHPPREPLTDERLHTFLNAAAGEGFVLDDVDAADLYIELFPERYAATVESIDSGDGIAADRRQG